MITADEQPSVIEQYQHRGPPPKSKYVGGSNTGKFKPSDLRGGEDKMAFENNLLNVPGYNPKGEDDDMSFASKNSIENMSAA